MSSDYLKTASAERSAEAWERVSVLFESALSLPPASRATFLDAACADDAALRAELLTLVASAEDAPRFLRGIVNDVIGPAFDAAVSVDDPDADSRDGATYEFPSEGEASPNSPSRSGSVGSIATSTTFSGRRIRHFEVRTLIGAGGMGVVYLGRDTMLGRDVALKFLSSDQVDPAARRRLIREAQAVSALDDRNVCAMYAIEEDEDSGLCLVMQYCADGTLRDRMRNNGATSALSVAQALDIATQIASGLASAHRSGIVHRDLKPANIAFVSDVAKILDFGVAVRFNGDITTASGENAALAGTLPYMAPEVIHGVSADVRGDVWALGVILHEMLTGRRPFAGETHAALLYAILDEVPPPMVRGDGAVIPTAVVQLVSAMLSKESARRPADGDEVLRRLRQCLDPYATLVAVPVAAKTSMVAVNASRAKSRLAPVVGSLAVGVVMLFALYAAQRIRSAPPETAPLAVARSSAPVPTIAVLPFAVRGGPDLQYLREGMVDLLTPAFDGTGLLRGVDPNSSIGAAMATGVSTIDSTTARAVADRLGAQRYVVGSVVREGEGLMLRATLHRADGRDVARAIASVAQSGGLSAGVESLVRQLISAELQAPGDTVAGLAANMTTSNRALRAYLDGERELRDARPAAAVTFFARAVQEDSLFALAWYRLARAARWSEVDSLSIRAAARAYALVGSLPLRLQQLVRGYHALRLGSPMDAERQFRQIVTDYPSDVDGWMLLGETLFDNNQYLGRPTNDAAVAFRTVMALDARNREVTVYLMELAARANRLGELDTLFQMYFSPNSAGEQPGIRQTYLALHARRARQSDRAITDPIGAQIALGRAGAEPSDLRAARQFATVLARPSNTVAMRVEGLLALATLSWSDGQPDAAGQYWRTAALLDGEATLLHRALMMATPTIEVSDDSLRAVRRALELPPRASTSGPLSRDEEQSVRLYLRGLLGRRLRDSLGLERVQVQLGRGPVSDRLAAPLAAALRGHLAVLRGDRRAAVAAFEIGMVSIPLDVRSRVPALGQQADRFALGDALRALGQMDDATRWYASIRDGPALWSTPYLEAIRAKLTP